MEGLSQEDKDKILGGNIQKRPGSTRSSAKAPSPVGEGWGEGSFGWVHRPAAAAPHGERSVNKDSLPDIFPSARPALRWPGVLGRATISSDSGCPSQHQIYRAERRGPSVLSSSKSDWLPFAMARGSSVSIYGLCPHARGHNVHQLIQDDGIRCNYHGWKFDVHGTCLETPMHPVGSGVDTLAFPVAEHAGLIWGYLGDDEPPTPPNMADSADMRSERRARPWLKRSRASCWPPLART